MWTRRASSRLSRRTSSWMGSYVPARFFPADAGATTKKFYAFVNIARGGAITATAYAADAAGNLGNSNTINITNIQSPDSNASPSCSIDYPD